MTRRSLGFGLLRVLAGRHLSCGCLVGLYETYSGDTVAIVDAPAPACPHPEHRKGYECRVPLPLGHVAEQGRPPSAVPRSAS